MTEERIIKAALKLDASQIQLPTDLLERINRQVDGAAPARPGFWARLRIGPKLEVLAACILLVGFVGIVGFHNLTAGRSPVGGGLPPAPDVTKAYFGGYEGAEEQPLDQSVVSTVLEWLKGAQVVGNDTGNTFNQGYDLLMELRNGGVLKVRLARDCVATKTRDSTHTTCRPAAGQVSLITATGEASRLRAPQLATWLLEEAAHRAPPQATVTAVLEGAGDPSLADMQATFAAPSFPARITEEQARESTIKNIGQPPAGAKVSVAYVLVTLPGPVVLNGKRMEAYPVYVVTYDGVRVSPSGPFPTPQGASGTMQTPAPGPQDAKGKVTAFIDANDGEWLMGVAR